MRRSVWVTGMLGLAVLVLSASCAQNRSSQPPTQPPAPAKNYSELRLVLQQAVDSAGNIRPSRLRGVGVRLDAQLAGLAVTGPASTPALFATPQERLAYWYNARLASELKLALLQDLPQQLNLRKLHQSPLAIDGQEITVAQIDQILLREHGWEAMVAAPGVTSDSAAAPQDIFEGETIEPLVRARLNQLIADPRRFVVDNEGQRVLVPETIWGLHIELEQSHNRRYGTQGANLLTALLPFTSGPAQRRLQDAMGYSIVPAEPSTALTVRN